MKKFVAIVLSALMVCALFANGTEETASAGFKPTKDVSWVCTSKPGGGSDIFTTQIKDAMKVNGITDANIVTEYITDGSGEVGRLQVSTTNKAKADYTLLTFNSGDLMPMVKNTDNRVENFRPLAIMAVDKQLLFVGEQSKYSSRAVQRLSSQEVRATISRHTTSSSQSSVSQNLSFPTLPTMQLPVLSHLSWVAM